MVRDNAAVDGDREGQHKDRQTQDGDQTVSLRIALIETWWKWSSSNKRSLLVSQKQLASNDVKTNMTTRSGKQISAYPKMGDKVSHDKRETKQYDLQRQQRQTEKGMKNRGNTLEEKQGKLHSLLLWKSSAIDALLYSEYE